MHDRNGQKDISVCILIEVGVTYAWKSKGNERTSIINLNEEGKRRKVRSKIVGCSVSMCRQAVINTYSICLDNA